MYECKEWINKDQVDKTWYNFKTCFKEAYFELKEDNELKKSRQVCGRSNINNRSSPYVGGKNG